MKAHRATRAVVAHKPIWRRESLHYWRNPTAFFLAVIFTSLCHLPISGMAQFVSFTQRLPDSDRRPSSPCLKSTLPGYTYFIDLDGKGCVETAHFYIR